MSWVVRLLLAVLLIFALGYWAVAMRGLLPERYNALSPLDPNETPNMLTGFKLWRIEGDMPACVRALKAGGAAFKVVPVHTETFEPGCELQDTVMLSKLSRAAISPEEMKCGVALRLYLHERYDIQPLARKYFGSGVARLEHFGSYSCRRMRGGSRMSEHATANAFDLAGYRLDNGRTVSLKGGWNGAGAQAAFLHDLRIRACLLFNLVLSPDFNADHADHFHLDMGLYRACN